MLRWVDVQWTHPYYMTEDRKTGMGDANVDTGLGRPGARHARRLDDRTADRALAAHYEHTIVITRSEPMLLNA